VYANGTGLCHGTHQRSTVIRFICPDDGMEVRCVCAHELLLLLLVLIFFVVVVTVAARCS
jgi:hypothetical protein